MTPIKSALLDQRIVAGLGNIYVCEALYRAGISPRRLAASVVGARAQRLATAIRQVLAEAIAAGGSSLRDYVQANGELGYFQHRWAVYGKEGEPCPDCNCAEGVRRISQAGRSTFFCGKGSDSSPPQGSAQPVRGSRVSITNILGARRQRV